MALDYEYNGPFEPVPVKVVQFHGMPDCIFSVQQWQQEGGWRGLIKINAFNLCDVEKVIDGKMDPVEFDNLQPWEG